MSFSSDVKREIVKKIDGKTAKNSALSAFIKTSGVVGKRDGKTAFFIVTETELLAEFFSAVFEELFKENLIVSRTSLDKMSGRGKLVLEYTGDNTEKILDKLHLQKNGEIRQGIDSRLLGGDGALGYVQGAYLGGGSCVLPLQNGGTGYHLEFAFPFEKDAYAFCSALEEFEIIGKVVERGSSFVVYVKSKETISDFLSVVGATNALKKWSEITRKRDESNNENRAANCFSGNADKSAKASVNQILAIEKLEKSGKMQLLSKELIIVATARKENPALSMRELAEKVGVSRSCLIHRLNRLLALSLDTEKI